MEVYDLIIGVLKRAKQDYITALRKKNHTQIAELEQFFLSDYGQAMSMNNGERIIELCKKIANKKRKQTVLTYKGETKTLYEWAKITGISRTTLKRRIYTYGWSVEKSLTCPVVKRKVKK